MVKNCNLWARLSDKSLNRESWNWASRLKQNTIIIRSMPVQTLKLTGLITQLNFLRSPKKVTVATSNSEWMPRHRHAEQAGQEIMTSKASNSYHKCPTVREAMSLQETLETAHRSQRSISGGQTLLTKKPTSLVNISQVKMMSLLWNWRMRWPSLKS